jgi:hypothetical protein
MVRSLRAGRGQTGLVLANGGTLTYQHVVCLASRAPNFPYPAANPLPEHLEDRFAGPIDEIAEGEAYIEVRAHILSLGKLLADVHHRRILCSSTETARLTWASLFVG